MTQDSSDILQLDDLHRGMPALTSAWGQALGEASAVCFHNQDHQSGVGMSIQATPTESCAPTLQVRWPGVTEQMIRTWNDLQEATEFGACGVAILLAKRVTGFRVVERARKGTGFDYWLGTDIEEMPFQKMARLEVSGILSGNESDVRSRVRQKLEQTNRSDGTFAAYIIVVEFGLPTSSVVQK